MTQPTVALITGGARRIGAGIAHYLHHAGMNLIIHYRHSNQEAVLLESTLNKIRPNSVVIAQLDLENIAGISDFIADVTDAWGYIDVLINNASSFYSTPIGNVSSGDWNDLVSSNLTAPFFLSQAAAPILKKQRGSIINIVDIKALQPAKQYPVYNIAKAGLWMLTKTLAKELAPDIRVNAIAPGPIIRPDIEPLTPAQLDALIQRIPLQRLGNTQDIAETIYFLIEKAAYITGQMIAIDGGRSLIADGDNDE